jgi:ABC-type sugar transport system substrate-binding protein
MKERSVRKRLNSLIPLLLAAVFILLAFAWVQSERGRTDDIVCQRDYNAAQSQRQQVLNDYTTARDYQRGIRDAANSLLLNGNWMRGSQENIDAFVCLEAISGKEVATVLSNNGIKGRTVIAMDTDPDTLQWIQKGVIAATISQKPYTMAYVGLKMLDDLHHENLAKLDSDWAHDSFAPVPAFVDTGSAVVDKSNVDSFVSAAKSITGQ